MSAPVRALRHEGRDYPHRPTMETDLPPGWTIKFMVMGALYTAAIEYLLILDNEEQMRQQRQFLRKYLRWIIRRYGPAGGSFLIVRTFADDPEQTANLIENTPQELQPQLRLLGGIESVLGAIRSVPLEAMTNHD